MSFFEKLSSFFEPVTQVFVGSSKNTERLILLGLDSAGKTTFLYKLKRPNVEVVTACPTIGFSVETLELKSFNVTCWDVGGCDRTRPIWRHYTPGSSMLIFVIDSYDRDRVDVAKHELDIFLKDETMVGVPLLILANKQDIPNAMSASEVVERFEINKIRDRVWYIQTISAVSGDGMAEAKSWIENTLKSYRKSQQQLLTTNPDKVMTSHQAEAASKSTEECEGKNSVGGQSYQI